MRQRFNTRQRNYIILGLCSILLVMAAGYAAFRTQLTELSLQLMEQVTLQVSLKFL